MAQKNIKKVDKFHLSKWSMFSFKVEGFSSSLDVLHGGIFCNFCNFCSKREKKSAVFFTFLVTKTLDQDLI
jgi:hypothetical protein